MKPLNKTRFTLFITALLLFTGCINSISNDNTDLITSDETGNINSTMDMLVKDGLNQQEAFHSAFPTIEGETTPRSSASLNGGSEATSLLKSRDFLKGDEDIVIDSSHINEGYVIVIINTTETNFIKHDSIWVEWDEWAQDDIEGNENIRSLHSVKKFHSGAMEDILIEDADGDGIVNGEVKYANRAKLTFQNTGVFGITEKSVLVVDAGDDHEFGENGNLAEQDNLMIAMKWERIKDNEVIAYGHFTDEDGDGILVDPSYQTPSTVRVELFESQNPLKPLKESSQLNMTLHMTSEEQDGEVISISGKEIFKNGTVHTVTALDADGSEILDPNDIVTVTLLSESPTASDSVRTQKVQFVLNIGSGLADSTDNQMLEVHALSEKRFGLIAKQEFHFVSDEPIPNGEEPTSGSVQITVTYRNGSTATLEGTFNEGIIDGTLTGPEGNSITFHWEE